MDMEHIATTMTTSLENPEKLSPEEIKIIRAVFRVIKEAELKESKAESHVVTTMDIKTNDISQTDTVNSEDIQFATPERTAVEPTSNNLDDHPETTGQLVATGGETDSLVDMAPEGRNAVSDGAHEETDRLGVGVGQTIAAQKMDAYVTSRYHRLVDLLTPVLDARENEKNKPDEDIHHKLYKRFKYVNWKLQLLENAISRLGGVGDVLNGIQQMRVALEITLRWDDHPIFGDDVRTGKLDSLEKVLERDWPDLKEDGEVFGAGAMEKAFDELGTVNGCQFVSLCTALRAVRDDIWEFREKVKRTVTSLCGFLLPDIEIIYQEFAASHDLEAERLAIKSIVSMFGGPLNGAFELLSNEITEAINRDIPNLRTAEQRVTDKYTSMSTTATFFSGITATAIQITVPMTGSALKDAVNTVWLTSLVFSVGSVIASLIGLSWLQSRMLEVHG
ncbi:hypothetical protein EW145_g6008 [Phellinidium pouzarii]|uniref:Uncharacterized protein n=1 Tax=Phellinidium pouzarii TaxID=167371 RepID=A0A4S4KY10_9AGAM|nr:hypothetical protein EW145_g6008 [Phellinidium pouzarii]